MSTETVDIDAEIRRWHVAELHIVEIDKHLDNITVELPPKEIDRLLAERERHARTQADARERLITLTA